MSELPKYARLEIERRWLVDFPKMPDLTNKKLQRIRDKYLNDTRLRLRRVMSSEGTVFKLGKKYGFADASYQAVTTIYLSAKEYEVLNALEGRSVEKLRHSLADGALDLYPALLATNVRHIYEVEFANEQAAARYTPPNFVTEEITAQARFRGIDFAMESA